MVQDIHKICTTLDKLTLDSLTLMEKHIQNKIDMEKAMSEGESNLAKARYIMGQNTVSKLQLPTEDTKEFEALAVVHRNENREVLLGDSYDLEIRRGNDDEVVQNPTRWFGILVPQALNMAQEQFKRALHWTKEATNTQIQLQETLKTIAQLKELKENIGAEE